MIAPHVDKRLHFAIFEELFAFELYQIIVHILYYVIALINGIREFCHFATVTAVKLLLILCNIYCSFYFFFSRPEKKQSILLS